MDYKSVFTNLCLELQQNRSWIKGLGKNPQKSELIHWRQCLLSGGTEACSLGLRETPACIHVIQRLSQPRVACWHGFRQNSQKTECVFTRCPTGGRSQEKKLRVYTASARSWGEQGKTEEELHDVWSRQKWMNYIASPASARQTNGKCVHTNYCQVSNLNPQNSGANFSLKSSHLYKIILVIADGTICIVLYI